MGPAQIQHARVALARVLGVRHQAGKLVEGARVPGSLHRLPEFLREVFRLGDVFLPRRGDLHSQVTVERSSGPGRVVPRPLGYHGAEPALLRYTLLIHPNLLFVDQSFSTRYSKSRLPWHLQREVRPRTSGPLPRTLGPPLRYRAGSRAGGSDLIFCNSSSRSSESYDQTNMASPSAQKVTLSPSRMPTRSSLNSICCGSVALSGISFCASGRPRPS